MSSVWSHLGLGFVLAFSLVFSDAHAHSYTRGSIEIHHPYAQTTRPGMRNGAVYFLSIQNKGETPDRLLSAQSSVAERVELHRMSMDGQIMRMREVESIGLLPNEKLSFRHGQSNNYHIMLLNLKASLKEGDRFLVSLRFENAGEIEITVHVQNLKENVTEHHHGK